MRFELCQGWRVSFRDVADSSATFRELTFASPDKLEKLIARTGTKMTLADHQALELGLRSGLGAIGLGLTDEQYHKLRDK